MLGKTALFHHLSSTIIGIWEPLMIGLVSRRHRRWLTLMHRLLFFNNFCNVCSFSSISHFVEHNLLVDLITFCFGPKFRWLSIPKANPSLLLLAASILNFKPKVAVYLCTIYCLFSSVKFSLSSFLPYGSGFLVNLRLNSFSLRFSLK